MKKQILSLKDYNDELFMIRAIQLAKRALGTARPNPAVGAVIVYDNKIIGEGFTSCYGGNHAEVNAIESVKEKELLDKSTIYVTLEPCSHYGKTPPCSNLIVKNKIPRLVIGCIDSNPLVSGKGIKYLKKANCNVKVGVLKEKCKNHHKRFFTVQNKKRPYIILKWAKTIDGFIAPFTKEEKRPVWISNTFSQQLVHKWRAQEHAILVGTNTVKFDNPILNVRSWFGNNPIRVLIDRFTVIPLEAEIFNNFSKTIVITDLNNSKKSFKNIFFEKIDFSKNITKQICNVLQKHKIQSLIVEGGKKTLQTFIDNNLWDEARLFIGNIEFKSGVKSPFLKNATLKKTFTIKKDSLLLYENNYC